MRSFIAITLCKYIQIDKAKEDEIRRAYKVDGREDK
jgi:hypothetical protein